MATPITPPKKTAPVDLKVRRHKVTPDASANETTLQRFLDTQSDSVDGVLAWLNSSFNYTAPVKGAKAATNPVMPITTKAGLTVNGSVAAGAVTASSVASSGPVSGTAINGGTVNGTTGTFSGGVSGTTATFPSSAFKVVVGPFTYAGAYPGGILTACFCYGSATINSNTYGFVMPYAGSIVAINGRVSNSVATNFQPYYYINGASTIMSNGAVAANTITSWGMTYAKNTLPVAAGTVIGLGVGWNSATSNNVQFSGFVTVEMAP